MRVFRQRIKAGGKEHGIVGFDRHDGRDYIRIAAWEGGETVSTVEFELDSARRLAELIQHALATKDRPNDRSCYDFEEAR